MTKRRLHHSSMWTNPNFGRLTMQQRLLVCGLIDCVDDQGRMLAHPALVRSVIFPYDDIPLDQMEQDLRALEANGTILLYEANGQRILQLVNWWKYQQPEWASPSTLPPPDGWQDRIRHRLGNKVFTYNWITRLGERLPDTCGPDGLPLEIPHGEPLPKDLGKGLGKASPKPTNYYYGQNYEHGQDNNYDDDNGPPPANSPDDPPDDPLDAVSPALVLFAEARGGLVTSIDAEEIGALAAECEKFRLKLPRGSPGADVPGETWVCEAIREANNARTGPLTLNFVRAILDRWRSEGFKSKRARASPDPPGNRSISAEERRRRSLEVLDGKRKGSP